MLTSRKPGLWGVLPEIGDMDEGIVEGGEDASDTEDKLAFAHLRTERDVLLWPVGRLCRNCQSFITAQMMQLKGSAIACGVRNTYSSLEPLLLLRRCVRD